MTPGWEEVLISSQIDGVAVTAAAATTLLPPAAKYTLPANFFSIGKQLRILASGRLSTLVTTPGTLRFDVRFGAIVVFDALAVTLLTANAYTNVGWYLDVLLTCRAIGAGTTANLMGQGTFTAPNITGGPDVAMPHGGVTAHLPWNSAPAPGTGFDSTVTNAVDLFFTQTVATGTITLHQFSLTARNQPS